MKYIVYYNGLNAGVFANYAKALEIANEIKSHCKGSVIVRKIKNKIKGGF